MCFFFRFRSRNLGSRINSKQLRCTCKGTYPLNNIQMAHSHFGFLLAKNALLKRRKKKEKLNLSLTVLTSKHVAVINQLVSPAYWPCSTRRFTIVTRRCTLVRFDCFNLALFLIAWGLIRRLQIQRSKTSASTFRFLMADKHPGRSIPLIGV